MDRNTNDAKLGQEVIEPGEAAIIEEYLQEMKAQVDELYKGKQMKRQVHTKMHGAVKARFKVINDLPEDLRIGVFQAGASYETWVRFSNASTIPKPDKKKDIRGIGLKLMNVPGEKILDGHQDEGTQDFLLMSSETFFSRNLIEFRKLLKASTAKSKFQLFKYFINPAHWGLLKRFLKLQINCSNPLEISYWSTQPYRFGGENTAVKYFLKPSSENRIINENTTEDNFLKINLAQTLASESAKFDFYIQFQENAFTMPIEDPTIPWKSKFIKVAELEIPIQKFDSAQQIAFGENLSFNPWHSLIEHKPLGSFNRARKAAYIAMSTYRHVHNHEKMFEPTDFSTQSEKEQ